MDSKRKIILLNVENNNGTHKTCIILNKKHRHKKLNDLKTIEYSYKEVILEPPLLINSKNNTEDIRKLTSIPKIKSDLKKFKLKRSSSLPIFHQDSTHKNMDPKNSHNDKSFDYYPFMTLDEPQKLQVYRCQLGAQEKSRCCSCNSDAMFEAMKSLYTCYKNKNCTNCDCIICGHLPREERIHGEIQKSINSITDAASVKARKKFIQAVSKALVGKTPQEKKKILKNLAVQGAPLPKGKTASEKELIRKIKKEVGLPAEPKTTEEKEKLRKAEEAGLIVPLEGKSCSEKETILKQQIKLGVPLPEGRTASEKALIKKVKAVPTTACIEKKAPSERELGANRTPLPECKTASDKVKHDKAFAKRLINSLEGKTAAQKEKNLTAECDAGIPKGRTSSEKALIKKVQAEEKRRTKAKCVDVPPLSTDKAIKLDKKTAKVMKVDKEPIDGGKCGKKFERLSIKSSEIIRNAKKLNDKVRHDMGLPPKPTTSCMKAKYAKAQADGLITPLEGKNTAQKEKLLKAQARAGLSLPKGRTPSEKALIKKVRAKAGVVSSVKSPPTKIPTEKIIKAREAGLITPLEFKTPRQKEYILRGLAEHGILLPTGKTASERKLIDKVRHDMGLSPEPTTSCMKAKYAKAQADGLITPLEGKNPAQKEKFLRAQARAGIQLPEGRTPSEKALVSKIRTEVCAVSSQRGHPPTKIPLEKIRKPREAGLIKKAKASGMGLTPESQSSCMIAKNAKAQADRLITPLEGKTPCQKQNILKRILNAGIPLPEGGTASKKEIIRKVERSDPILTAMPSEKLKAAGLCVPLSLRTVFSGFNRTPSEEKTSAERKKVINDSLPVPEGITAPEKALIMSMSVPKGLPPEPTSPERLRVIETKSKKVGVGESAKKYDKRIGVNCQTGITEEIENVLKTTCERGCGCDKKKIKFKHSYVNKKVTSPVISSLCPCPGECIPGVKGGVFVDNEGIKITVGSAIGLPLFTSIQKADAKSNTVLNDTSIYSSTRTDYVIEEIYSNVFNINKQNLSEDLAERQDNEREICYEHMINEPQRYKLAEDTNNIPNNHILQYDNLRSCKSYDPKGYGSLESIEGTWYLSGTESSLSFSVSLLSMDSGNTFKQYLDYKGNPSTGRFNHKHSESLSESNEYLLVSKSSEHLVIYSNSNKKPIISSFQPSFNMDFIKSQNMIEMVKEILLKKDINQTSSVRVAKTDSSTICTHMPKNYFNHRYNDSHAKTNTEYANVKSLQYSVYGQKITSTSKKYSIKKVTTNSKSCKQRVVALAETTFKEDKEKIIMEKVVAEQTIRRIRPNTIKANNKKVRIIEGHTSFYIS